MDESEIERLCNKLEKKMEMINYYPHSKRLFSELFDLVEEAFPLGEHERKRRFLFSKEIQKYFGGTKYALEKFRMFGFTAISVFNLRHLSREEGARIYMGLYNTQGKIISTKIAVRGGEDSGKTLYLNGEKIG